MAWSGDTAHARARSSGDDFTPDHLVNQHPGSVGKGANPIGLFLEHAVRLKAAGL